MKTKVRIKTTKQARKYSQEENRLSKWVDVQVERQAYRTTIKLENEDYYRHLANEIHTENDMGGNSSYY